MRLDIYAECDSRSTLLAQPILRASIKHQIVYQDRMKLVITLWVPVASIQ